jgi:hypothetical protein
MEIVISYKFKLDEEVVTFFNDKGVITMLGFDDGGIQYYVKTAKDSQWYKEKHLFKK